MDKFKIKIDQPELSDADILKHKGFGEVMKAVKQVQLPWYKTGKFWGLTGGSIVVITVTTVLVMNANKSDVVDTTLPEPASVELANPVIESPIVNPPFAETDVPFETFSIDPSVDNEIITEARSIVFIPAGSILNKDGSRATEQVEVRYRDFYSPYEIFLAGIPMEIDQNGTEEHLESAGMYELTTGAEHSIDASRPIEVYFKSTSTDGSYDQYVLNDEGWEHDSPCKPVATTAVSNKNDPPPTRDEVPLVKPTLEEDHTRMLPIGTNQINLFPELKGYENLCLRFNDEDKQFADPAINPSNYSIERSDKPNTYILKLTVRDKTFEVEGTPAFSKVHYDAAMKLYKEQSERIKEKEKRKQQSVIQDESDNSFGHLSEEAGFLLANSKGEFQSFQVIRFGMHNCDRILQEKPKPYFVEYNSREEKAEVQKIYSFFPEINSIYSGAASDQIEIQRNDRSIVVFICQDDKMSVSYLKDIRIDKHTIKFTTDHLISSQKAKTLLATMI